MFIIPLNYTITSDACEPIVEALDFVTGGTDDNARYAVFGYDGDSTNLTVMSKGSDLSLIPQFQEGIVQFGFLRVFKRFLAVGWYTNGTNVNRVCSFNAHLVSFTDWLKVLAPDLTVVHVKTSDELKTEVMQFVFSTTMPTSDPAPEPAPVEEPAAAEPAPPCPRCSAPPPPPPRPAVMYINLGRVVHSDATPEAPVEVELPPCTCQAAPEPVVEEAPAPEPVQEEPKDSKIAELRYLLLVSSQDEHTREKAQLLRQEREAREAEERELARNENAARLARLTEAEERRLRDGFSLNIRAKALYAYTKTQDSELSLAVDEEIIIISDSACGWWYGQSLDGSSQGFFPSNYIDVQLSEGKLMVKAKKSHTPAEVLGEIMITEGDDLTNLRKHSVSWWCGLNTVTGKTGFFPSDCL